MGGKSFYFSIGPKTQWRHKHAGLSFTRRQPEIKQQVSITWAGRLPFTSSPPHQYAETGFRVVGALLVLRFQDLMDRPPVPSADEHDVMISEHDLQNVAVRIWRRRE
ncbi:uncharacterized protein SPSK_10094 [Sporothrix schenckii 1099-18]|uniref:Uncharacterized protein n=1 Tax=Sporothrix schenckii 1099-18 TaxID=1397361 RepID=A0A0F2M8E1_SPOSC|nr:uncharacterized protein SPSK_10094 [Sporothrix schenckii 1099-18]KJR85080.1 hypothetical protein SPSK_10094 [Sporothrix schenckii 1099-18]